MSNIAGSQERVHAVINGGPHPPGLLRDRMACTHMADGAHVLPMASEDRAHQQV